MDDKDVYDWAIAFLIFTNTDSISRISESSAWYVVFRTDIINANSSDSL